MRLFYSNKHKSFHFYKRECNAVVPPDCEKFVKEDIADEDVKRFMGFIGRKYDCGFPEIEQLRKDYYAFFKESHINHPSHYTDGKIEVIDFIEDKNLNYHRGNAIKYISRAGKKDPSKEIEDLKKAVWYLNREIQRIEKGH